MFTNNNRLFHCALSGLCYPSNLLLKLSGVPTQCYARMVRNARKKVRNKRNERNAHK